MTGTAGPQQARSVKAEQSSVFVVTDLKSIPLRVQRTHIHLKSPRTDVV